MAYEGKLEDREVEVYNHDSKVALEQQKKVQELWHAEKQGQVEQINTSSKQQDSDPEDDYQHEVQAAKNLIVQNKQRENFRFRGDRELQRELNKGNFTRGRIKIRFPDQFVIVASFGAKETVQSVYDFVKEYIQQKGRDFILFETPPKRVLKAKEKKLFEVKLVPSATLYFGWADLDSTKAGDGPFLDMLKCKPFVTAF